MLRSETERRRVMCEKKTILVFSSCSCLIKILQKMGNDFEWFDYRFAFCCWFLGFLELNSFADSCSLVIWTQPRCSVHDRDERTHPFFQVAVADNTILLLYSPHITQQKQQYISNFNPLFFYFSLYIITFFVLIHHWSFFLPSIWVFTTWVLFTDRFGVLGSY